MKRYPLFLFVAVLLAACQSQTPPATPILPTNPPVIAVAKTKIPVKGTGIPATAPATAAPTQAALILSGNDPNAANLLAVRDQSIVNNSLTVDTVVATQPGWLVLYFEKRGSPGHQVTFTPIPAGKSRQVVIPIGQNPGDVPVSLIPGNRVFVILQAGPKAPGKPVNENGHMVNVRFNVLP